MAQIRKARKDKYSSFGGQLIAKKGEWYLDKGFNQCESVDNWLCPQCKKPLGNNNDANCPCGYHYDWNKENGGLLKKQYYC